MKSLAEFLKISIYVCGKSVSPGDIEGIQILIGTPEIVFKMLKLGEINVSAVKIMAVDESDKLVSQGEMKGIFEYMNENIQVAMFSTTMAEDALETMKKFARDPVIIVLKREELMLERIRHFYILVDEKESKSEILVELLQEGVGKEVILFVITVARYDSGSHIL